MSPQQSMINNIEILFLHLVLDLEIVVSFAYSFPCIFIPLTILLPSFPLHYHNISFSSNKHITTTIPPSNHPTQPCPTTPNQKINTNPTAILLSSLCPAATTHHMRTHFFPHRPRRRLFVRMNLVYLEVRIGRCTPVSHSSGTEVRWLG
jgi:hypothetical protein